MGAGARLYDEFLKMLSSYYRQYGRHDLPWRLPEADGSFDPYKILVSEIMLQQTQVPRVIPKYHEFLRRFPTFAALAEASLGDVLVVWQGLGYNRRAKFLRQAAQLAVHEYDGTARHDQRALERLPGVGRNTAGAIMAYAFNEPAVFIETNIRTVYIHHFFKDQLRVSDKSIEALLAQTMDRANPRAFYWSLMDYGSYVKQAVGNLSRASKGYAKQSKFHGSLRQLRGKTLQLLAAGPVAREQLVRELHDERAAAVLGSLEREGLIQKAGEQYRLP